MISERGGRRGFRAGRRIASLCFVISLMGSTAACKRSVFSNPNLASKRESDDDVRTYVPPPLSSMEYVRRCEAALGPLPSIDCTKGHATEPLRAPSAPLPVKGLAAIEALRLERPDLDGKECFNSSKGAGERCDFETFGFLPGTGMAPNQSGALFAYICRKEDPTRFKQVLLIGTNPASGETCFFQSRKEHKFDSNIASPALLDETSVTRRVPGPSFGFESVAFGHVGIDDPTEKSEAPTKTNSVAYLDFPRSRVWESPITLAQTDMPCVRCHSARPFVRTAFVLLEETRHALQFPTTRYSGRPTVPLFAGTPNVPAPYVVIGEGELNEMKIEVSGKRSTIWTPKHLVGSAIAACTRCHVIGGDAYASKIAPQFIGLTKVTQFIPWPNETRRREDVHARHDLYNQHVLLHGHNPAVRKFLPVPSDAAPFERSEAVRIVEIIKACADTFGRENKVAGCEEVRLGGNSK